MVLLLDSHFFNLFHFSTYLIEFRCDITKDNTNYWWNDYCFSEDTTVDVLGKGEVKMSDLAVGDKIRAGESYEPVYAFAHLHKTTTAPYLHISTDSPNAPLEVTAEHLLYVNGKYTAAKDVKVGDILMDGSHTEAKVQKITIKQKAGLYAPLTPSGTLIVNGIQTSAYVSLQKNAQATLKLGNLHTRLSFHSLNHIALSPIRMACMGISSNFCSNEHIDVESGYPPFVSFWFALVQWFEHQALAVQLALLVVFFCVVGPLFLAESILGATFAPAILLCGASIVLRRFVKTQNNASEKVKQL
jgi:Hint module